MFQEIWFRKKYHQNVEEIYIQIFNIRTQENYFQENFMLRDPFEVVIILYNISPSGIIKFDLALL
jgi:hypothetical protein